MTDTTLKIKPPRILIVEDNEAYRNMIKNAMELTGFSVFAAENGVRGLEIARGEFPDLILLDVYMPQMDGMSMLAELKKDMSLTKIPVIMLTNVQEELEHAIERGAEEALLKSSFTPRQLIDVCQKHLNNQLQSATNA